MHWTACRRNGSVREKMSEKHSGREGFRAGVHDYREAYYDPGYRPSDTDILAAFRVTPQADVPAEEAGAAFAAHPSTGTRTSLRAHLLPASEPYPRPPSRYPPVV